MDPTVIWAMTKAGPVSLHSLETTRVSGLDMGGRVAEVKRLLSYNATAARNQHARNLREARLRREAKTVTQAMQAPANDSIPESPAATPKLNEFTELANTSLPNLTRRRSNDNE
jgi:hypothetical protein